MYQPLLWGELQTYRNLAQKRWSIPLSSPRKVRHSPSAIVLPLQGAPSSSNHPQSPVILTLSEQGESKGKNPRISFSSLFRLCCCSCSFFLKAVPNIPHVLQTFVILSAAKNPRICLCRCLFLNHPEPQLSGIPISPRRV
jgi:hypothetical protein